MKISNNIIIRHENVELALFLSKWGIVGREFPMLFHTSRLLHAYNLSLNSPNTTLDIEPIRVFCWE